MNDDKTLHNVKVFKPIFLILSSHHKLISTRFKNNSKTSTESNSGLWQFQSVPLLTKIHGNFSKFSQNHPQTQNSSPCMSHSKQQNWKVTSCGFLKVYKTISFSHKASTYSKNKLFFYWYKKHPSALNAIIKLFKERCNKVTSLPLLY